MIGGMSEVSRTIPTTPERVWEVLAEGWSYAGWVVGASHPDPLLMIMQ